VTPRHRLQRHRFLIAGAGLGAVLLGFDLWLASAVAPPHVALPDFYVYHLAARIGLAHGWASIYDPSLFQPAVTPVVGRYLPYLNPPLLAWLVTPLTVVPYAVAAVLWLTLLAACLGVTCWLVAPGGVTVRLAQLIGATALLPVFIGFEFGQASLLVVVVVAIAWWLIRRDRLLAAGLVLALLALKPQVAVLVPFALLLAGYRRVFVGWIVATVPLAVVSWLAVGPAGLKGVKASLQLAQGLGGPLQISIWHVVPIAMLAAAAALLALMVTLVIAYRNRGRGPEMPIAAGLVGTVLVSPYVNYYDLAALVLAAWLVLRTQPRGWQRALIPALYLPVYLAPLWAWPAVLAEAVWLLALAQRGKVQRVGEPVKSDSVRPKAQTGRTRKQAFDGWVKNSSG